MHAAPPIAIALLLALAVAGPARADGLRLSAERPGAVELTWTPAPDATGYAVWRREGLRQSWQRVGQAPGDATTYLDRAVSGRRFYSYRVAPEGGASPREAGPVEALAPYYLELREAADGVATLRIHQWDQVVREWRRSDEVRIAAGRRVVAVGVAIEFDPGATLVAAGPDPAQADVGRALYRTRQGQLIEITTRDSLPIALRRRKKPAPAPAAPAVARADRPTADAPPPPAGGPTPVSLDFPEPKRIGTCSGGRVVWEIENASKMSLLLVITGRVGRTFKVGPEKTFVVKLPGGGDYEVVANAQDNKIIPLRGEFGLQTGIRYKSVLGLRPAGH